MKSALNLGKDVVKPFHIKALKKKNNKWDERNVLMLISKGHGGVFGEGISYSTGQLSPFHSTFYCNDFFGTYKGTPFEKLEDGGFLIDKTVCENIVRNSLDSPLLEPRLKSGEVERFGQEARDWAATILPALGGQFQTIIGYELLHQNSDQLPANVFGSLDKVALDFYLAWWWVRGARVGRKQNNEAIWFPNYGQQELF